TISFAERSGPDSKARRVRSFEVMTLTREPPMSIARITGGAARFVVFFAINRALPYRDNTRVTKTMPERSNTRQVGFVRHPTPFCSQGTNRINGNQCERSPNKTFAYVGRISGAQSAVFVTWNGGLRLRVIRPAPKDRPITRLLIARHRII